MPLQGLASMFLQLICQRHIRSYRWHDFGIHRFSKPHAPVVDKQGSADDRRAGEQERELLSSRDAHSKDTEGIHCAM
jgi:hypothetical protein